MVKINNKKTESLMKAILILKDIKEAKSFFRDLLTEQELIEFSNRWRVAQMLYNNTPYSKIEKETGLSSTTIARVSKWLNNGKNGYKSMIEKSNSHHHNNSFRKKLC